MGWEAALGWAVFPSSVAEVGADPVAGAGTGKHDGRGRWAACGEAVAGQGGEPPAGQLTQELCWQSGLLDVVL